jgi:hypothetical protein
MKTKTVEFDLTEAHLLITALKEYLGLAVRGARSIKDEDPLVAHPITKGIIEKLIERIAAEPIKDPRCIYCDHKQSVHTGDGKKCTMFSGCGSPCICQGFGINGDSDEIGDGSGNGD